MDGKDVLKWVDTEVENHLLPFVLEQIEKLIEQGLHSPELDAKVESLMRLGWTKTKEQIAELIKNHEEKK